MFDMKEHVNKLYERYNVKGVEGEHGPYDFQSVFGASVKYVRDRLGANFSNEGIMVVLYEETMNSILDYLKTKTKSSNAFSLGLGVFSIGFTNETLENDEKIGNITVNISPIANSSIKDFDFDDDPSRNAKTFKERNNIAAGISELDKIVMKKLNDLYGVKLGISELVIPAFIIAHRMILTALENAVTQSPNNEMEINVFGFYTVTAVKSGSNVTFYYLPDDAMKYRLKDDVSAQIESK